jgi:hypothetical protein
MAKEKDPIDPLTGKPDLLAKYRGRDDVEIVPDPLDPRITLIKKKKPEEMENYNDEQMLQQIESQYATDARYNMTQADLIREMQAQPTSDLIRWQLDPKDYLLDMERILSAAYYDPSKRVLIPDEQNRLINNKGLHKIKMIMQSHLTKNIILSNLEMDEIEHIIINLMVEVIDHLENNWQEYQINKTDLGFIIHIIHTQAYALLKRAYKEGERKFLKTTERRIETHQDRGMEYVQSPQQQRKKFLGFI